MTSTQMPNTQMPSTMTDTPPTNTSLESPHRASGSERDLSQLLPCRPNKLFIMTREVIRIAEPALGKIARDDRDPVAQMTAQSVLERYNDFRGTSNNTSLLCEIRLTPVVLEHFAQYWPKINASLAEANVLKPQTKDASKDKPKPKTTTPARPSEERFKRKIHPYPVQIKVIPSP